MAVQTPLRCGIASQNNLQLEVRLGHRRCDAHSSDTGCFVTAPDLLGHGLARRSDDYSIAALANELRPLLAADHYHIVVGASLGGVVAAALLPCFTHPVHVVLVDPPLEQSPEVHDLRKTLILQMVRNPLTPEGFHKLLPTQTFEDAIFRSVSTRLCDAATVEALFDVGLVPRG